MKWSHSTSCAEMVLKLLKDGVLFDGAGKPIIQNTEQRKLCHNMKILFATETKATYQEEFVDFFEFVSLLGK